MPIDTDGPAITGTTVIGQRTNKLGVLLQKMRMVTHLGRGRVLDDGMADALVDGLDAVLTELGALRDLTVAELETGAAALEAAHGVLRAIGAEGRLKPPREAQPAVFEGVFVPPPERPRYLKDMARPNVVILADVRRARPEGGKR